VLPLPSVERTYPEVPADVGRVRVHMPAVLEAWIVSVPEVEPASLSCPVGVPVWPMVKAGDSQVRLAEAPKAPELLNCTWVLVPVGVVPPEAEIMMMFGVLVAMVMLVPATREVVALVRPLMAVMPLRRPHPRHEPVTLRLLTVVVAELTVKLPGMETFKLLCPMVMAVAKAVPMPNVPLVSTVILASPCKPALLTVRVARLELGHDSSKAKTKTATRDTKGMRPLSFVLRINFLNG